MAPPLLEAYAQLLAALLPHAQQEEAALPAGTLGEAVPCPPMAHGICCAPGGAYFSRRFVLCQLPPPLPRASLFPAGTGPAAKQGRPLSMTAQMVQRLLRLPPPLQHMLAPGCAALLRVAAADAHGDARQALAQHAALLWMLAQQRHAYQVSEAGVELPADCPPWLPGESLLLERSSGAFQQHRSSGHALLLGPAPGVQQAAALELLQQLRLQLEAAQQEGGALPADELVAAADACHAAMQRLALEHQAQRRRLHAAEGGSDASSEAEEEEEEEQAEPLLLGSRTAAEVAALAAAVCSAGAAAAATVAAALDAAATGGAAAQQQLKAQHQGGEPCEAAAEAAGMLVLCTQLLEPADCLLQSGCLPPAAAQQLEAACEQLDGQGQAVDQLARGLPERHPLMAAVHAAMAEAPALWQPAGEDADEEAAQDGSGGSSGEEGSKGPSSRHRSKGGGGSSKGGASAKPKGRREREGERRRRMRDVRNPAVRAMLAEDGGAGGLSGLGGCRVCCRATELSTADAAAPLVVGCSGLLLGRLPVPCIPPPSDC